MTELPGFRESLVRELGGPAAGIRLRVSCWNPGEKNRDDCAIANAPVEEPYHKDLDAKSEKRAAGS